jgi:hypothetical protein
MGNSNTSPFRLRALPAITLLGLLWFAGCAHKTPDYAGSPAVAPPPSAPAVAAVPAKAPAPPQEDRFKAAIALPPAPFEGDGWEPLFDGQTLTGWRQTPFAGHGEIEVHDGLVLARMGDPFTGLNYTNEFPKMNYEIALDAMRANGADFFCGLTLPIGDSFCSLIVGGWGGALVGISSLDGMDASENETTKYQNFQQNRWYRIRLRITQGRIEGWIDQEKLIDVVTTGKRISLRPGEIEESKPMGLACWQTSAAWRAIQLRRVDQPADKPRKY